MNIHKWVRSNVYAMFHTYIQNIYSQTIYQHLFDSMFAKLWINPKCNEASFNHAIFLIKVI